MSQNADSPQTVLITGAGRRIGAALALDLARHGWAVGVHYLSSEAQARQIVETIRAEGGRAEPLKADLAKTDEAMALVGRCIDALGPPTCLINNSSVFLDDTIATVSPKTWDAHMQINLTAPVLLAQAFAAALPKETKGNIINIIDQRVWKLTPLFFSYTLSKAGLWTATRTLAQALSPHIRVNAIGPGPVLQSIHQNEKQFADQQRATPLQHETTPDDLAAAVRYILSAPAMTGQMIALDGGQHLAWQTPDVFGVEK